MKIGIDVDGVIADNHTAWLARYNRAHEDAAFTPDDLTQWEFWHDLLPGCDWAELKSYWTPDIYSEVQPFAGAVEAIRAIEAMGHEVHYITSCTRGNAEFIAKLAWLQRHGFQINNNVWGVGPEFAWKSKEHVAEVVKIDWLVDDHIPHVEAWPGHAYLMTRPHNQRLLCTRKRVKSLEEVVHVLKVKGATASVMHAHAGTLSQLPDADAVQKMEAAVYVPIAKSGVLDFAGKVDSAKGSLPSDWQARKDTPIVRGMLDYFPNAAAEIARISAAGNKQHFTPGTPLHWDYAKSADHADSCVRHLMDRGTIDTDGTRHMAKAAWRAMAALETELIEAGATPGRAVKMPEA